MPGEDLHLPDHARSLAHWRPPLGGPGRVRLKPDTTCDAISSQALIR